MDLQIEIPGSTKRRLVQLLGLLKNWPEEKITSVAISDSTGWKSSLIRHDLWLIGFNKGVSNGYKVEELQKAIVQVLGLESSEKLHNSNESEDASVNIITGSVSSGTLHRKVCVVGLGRLGAALLDQNLVNDSSFVIKAGFDSNLNRVEILRSSFPLYPASEMNSVIKREDIKYALLTVSDKEAQSMADRLVKSGILGIVNITNVMLKVPESVKVENISILNALNLVI